MNDPYGLIASGIPPEMMAEYAKLAKQQQIADAMMAQGMRGPQNLGGPGSTLSWTQGLAQMLQAYNARAARDAADKGMSGLADKRRQMVADAISDYQQRVADQPAIPAPPEELGGGPGAPIRPADPIAKRNAITEAMVSGLPEMRRLGERDFAVMEAEKKREDEQAWRHEQARMAAQERAAARADTLAAKAQELTLRLEDRALDRASREDMNKRLMALNKELGMARVEATRYAADARKDAAAAKASEKDEAKQRAQQTVTSILEDLAGRYDALDKMGAIVNTEKGALANLKASAGASGAGQFVGRVLGSSAQTIRDEINQTSPMLMNAIRQATPQLGARSLDSNAELRFYLQAVTDPTKSVQFNRAALKVLDKMYGLGTGVKGVSEDDERAVRAEWERQSKGSQPPSSQAPVVVDW